MVGMSRSSWHSLLERRLLESPLFSVQWLTELLGPQIIFVRNCPLVLMSCSRSQLYPARSHPAGMQLQDWQFHWGYLPISPESLGLPSGICRIHPVHFPHESSPHFYLPQERKKWKEWTTSMTEKSIPREGAYIEFLVENSIFISTSASEIV